jgi:hypothetical protein
MISSYKIDGQVKYAINSLNFSIKGTPFLITKSSIQDNGDALHDVKNTTTKEKKTISHARLVQLLLSEKENNCAKH